MRHSKLFLISLVLVGLLGSTSAMIQQRSRQLSEEGQDTGVAARERTYFSEGSRHKLMLGPGDQSTYSELLSKNAVIDEINYGSFRMVLVDEDAIGGRTELARFSDTLRDDQNLIKINGYVIDTTNPNATYDKLPSDMRQPDLAQLLSLRAAPRGGLYIVQFAGPVQDAWLDSFKDNGAEIVSYLASNAYVIRAGGDAASMLPGLFRLNRFVQFMGDYEPGFRLSPELQALREKAPDLSVDITVQVIDGAGAEQTVDSLASMATSFAGSYQILNYRNVWLTVPASRLSDIARLDDVFAVEGRYEKRLLDEAQGQIVAGNLSGNSPTGPGYLTFLAQKGFTSSQFGSFVVEVVDDCTSLTGHPDLPSSRIAFQNNPTGQTGAQGGHGFLNSNIIGGFNSGTGSAVEDALGFNYGLGIAPFARMGTTAIFGSGSATPNSWESTAYGQGARVSSNSWGFTTSTGAPIPDYDSNSQTYDALVRDAQTGAGLQQLTIVFAAGNDGSGA
ncbi:MAG TPA: S8 family serine peptidase, partial [Blastocatellia bacterium]|nr:S8 family serine peptidase [Blastocatellia bacterium]